MKSTSKSATNGKLRDGASRERKRDLEVVDAAVQAFSARGYAAATVQDVADTLGILKGSLYHYISSKEDLLFAIFEAVHEDVDEILQVVVASTDRDPLDRIALYVRRQVEYNLNNLQRVSIYYHEVEQLGEARRKIIMDRRHQHDQFITSMIAAAQDSGAADATHDARLLKNCVFATITGTSRWYGPGNKSSRLKIPDVCSAYAVAGIVGTPS